MFEVHRLVYHSTLEGNQEEEEKVQGLRRDFSVWGAWFSAKCLVSSVECAVITNLA